MATADGAPVYDEGRETSNGDGPILPRGDGPWTERVVFAATAGGARFALRPRELLTDRVDEAVVVANEVEANAGRARVDPQASRQIGQFRRLLDVADPLGTVAHLRALGFVAEPNYVFFSHGCGCGCGCGQGSGHGSGAGCPPHPAGAWRYDAESVHPTPFGGHSVHPTPFGGHSVHPTPFGYQSVHPTPWVVTSVHPTPWGGCGCCPPGGANVLQSVHPTPASRWPVGPASVHPTPYGCCGCGRGHGPTAVHSVHPTPFGTESVHPTPRRSSARPQLPGSAAAQSAAAVLTAPHPAAPAHVVVLDTGLATESQFPPAMATCPVRAVAGDGFDEADTDPDPVDNLLDEVAGHGTFIAGLVAQVAPGCDVTVHKVLAPVGDTDEETIVHRLQNLTFDDPTRTVLTMSFGGYLPEHPQALAAAVRAVQAQGVVVVASAGNDGTCQPMYPAALPGVVSVGAIGPRGPASFTNYGPWVRACAPGVELTSTFFVFGGAEQPAPGQPDPDDFDGWAVWSGTSFSAPLVAGALARTMTLERCTAREAVERVVDDPSLLRLPGLGTVVNVV